MSAILFPAALIVNGSKWYRVDLHSLQQVWNGCSVNGTSILNTDAGVNIISKRWAVYGFFLHVIYLHVLNTQCHHVCYAFFRYFNCTLFEMVSRWPSLAAAGLKRLYDRFRPCRVNMTSILNTDAGVYIICKRLSCLRLLFTRYLFTCFKQAMPPCLLSFFPLL